LLAAPISSLSYVYGWICLTDKLGAEEFSVEDEQLLTILAAQVGRIYENGSLYAKVQRHAMDLQKEIVERQRIEDEVRETRNFLASIFDNIPNMIFVKDAGELRFVRLNPAGEKLIGYSEKELLGKNDYDFFPKDQADFFVAKDRETLSSREGLFVVEETITTKDGIQKILQTKKLPVLGKDGSPRYLLGFSEDITERKEQEQKIARLSRIQEVLSGINSAIVRIRDRQELFKEACRIAVEHGRFSLGWIAMLDQASGKLVPVAQAGLPLDLGAGVDSSNRPVGLAPGGTAEVALRERRPAFDNNIEGKPGSLNSEIGPDTLSVRRAAIRLGAKSVIVLPLYVEGKTFGILTLYAPERNFFDDEELKLLTELAGDISFGLEFIAKEEKVDYLAYYDALTGLPNRSLFFDRLTHQLGTATRERLNVALVLMDIDRFRLINDTLGRQAGDALIAAVAKRINTTVRDQDTVARVGADSFAVAVSGTWGATDAARVLESHNRQLFGQPFVLGGEELRVAATTGVAMFPGDGDNPEVLFANAEAALKKAKSSGERFLFYGPEMNASVADALRLENRLRQALENGEMVLWYQPKVSVKTRKLTGLEALMRWQDPETGMVPPARFIPLMEQTGLILDAGKWAMSQVARDCTLWAKDGFKPARVAVNVSPIELRQKDFVATVVEAAQKTEEAGSMLDLEITESVIMENVEAIIPILQTVRGRGVEIAVDDFGTGYSSLAYIARLPINDLKIDRSFVNGMTQSQDSLTIVRSVISLAHSLRLNVVAEGVETEEQAALLLELGCDEMQGYLISRPVPPDKVPELLSRQKIAAIRPARRRSRRSPVR
jgi:diguanylate cyclase (GGDEF)-like protein/PAS domain S-box-containing protein